MIITELPEDVTIDLFLRQPVESLMRLKCVCKVWYNLIHSLYFDNLYNHRRKKKVSLFRHSVIYSSKDMTIQFRLYEVSTLKLVIPDPFGFRLDMVGCSYGLVCFSLKPYAYASTPRSNIKFVVWNPFTSVYRVITTDIIDRNLGVRLKFGFVFDPVNYNFKLAQILFMDTPKTEGEVFGCVQVDIFTSRMGDSWTRKKIDFPCPFYERGEIIEDCLSSVGRNMYWLVRRRYRYRVINDYYIIQFDMVNEMFTRIELPTHDYYNSYVVALFRYGESLAVYVCERSSSRTSPYDISVWLMMNHDGEGNDQYSWYKKPSLRVPEGNYGYLMGSIRKDEDDWVVLRNCSISLLCNLNTGETMEFYECGEYQFFLYGESLTSVINYSK